MQVPIQTPPKVAGDYMTREVHTVQMDWPLDTLADFFIEMSISGAPVVANDETLVGVVTLRDVVRALSFTDREAHRHTTNDYYLRPLDGAYADEDLATLRLGVRSEQTVRDVMTPAAYSVDIQTSVQEAADVMIRGRLHRLLVTEAGQLTGILSAVDLLQIVRDL